MCRYGAPVVVFVVENDSVTHIGVTTALLQARVLTCHGQRSDLPSVAIGPVPDSISSGSEDWTYAELTITLMCLNMKKRTVIATSSASKEGGEIKLQSHKTDERIAINGKDFGSETAQLQCLTSISVNL